MEERTSTEREERSSRANRSFNRELVVKPFCGFYIYREVPEELDDDGALEHARQEVKRLGCPGWLLISPEERIWLDGSGEIIHRQILEKPEPPPYMRLGRRRGRGRR